MIEPVLLRKRYKFLILEFPFHKFFHDIISCQFAIHYAFETCTKAEQTIRNIAGRLKKNGLFIGTTVNDMELIARLRTQHETNGELSFGNRVYTVTFDKNTDVENIPLFGCRYDFELVLNENDTLITMDEFLVNKQLMVKICQEYGLELVYWLPTRQFYERFKPEPNYQSLLDVFKALRPFNQRSKYFNEERDIALDYQRPRQALKAILDRICTCLKTFWFSDQVITVQCKMN